MSTYHDTSMGKIVTIQKGWQEKEIQKPVCILDYTKHVVGVDHSDHYCAAYVFIRKSPKWWNRLFLVPGSIHCKFIHFVQQL